VQIEARHREGLVAINLAAVIFGTAALFGTLAVSPFWIVAGRAAFASAALAALGIGLGKLGPAPAAVRRPLAVSGAVLALHWLTFFASVQRAGVAIATLTFATFPLFTLVLETVRAGRRPAAIELGAAAAIVGAVALLVDPGSRGPAPAGALAGLASAITFAYFGVVSKGLTRVMTPVTVSLLQNVAVVGCLAPALAFASPAPQTLRDWFWLAVLGVVTTALMHQLYLFALARLSATTCSGFVALEPVYAVGFAALLFGEPVTLWVVVSGALIVGASLTLLRMESARHVAGGRR
jgi:drug/metabolite transporter (DMT)-like permease